MYWKEILDIYERMGVENIIPIAHTRIKPNIKVLLDESGNFVGATLNEQDRFTIPCTIESESRTSGCAPHPIHDNMQYLCNEYNDPKCKEKNESYMKQLGEYIEEVDDELAKSVYKISRKRTSQRVYQRSFKESKSSGRKGNDLFRDGNEGNPDKGLHIGRIRKILPVRATNRRRARPPMA